MSFKFLEFPNLATDRLVLRKITKSDGPTIFFLRTDKEVNKYIHRPIPHKTVKEAEDFIDKTTLGIESGKNINWGISLPYETDLIGSICLWNFSEDRKKAEVGYDLHPNYHSQGIMSEALCRIIEFGFLDLKLDEIEAFTHYKNESSKKLLIKNNFILNKDRSDDDNPNNINFVLKNTSVSDSEIQ